MSYHTLVMFMEVCREADYHITIGFRTTLELKSEEDGNPIINPHPEAMIRLINETLD